MLAEILARQNPEIGALIHCFGSLKDPRKKAPAGTLPSDF
jgi:hypothetical protein